MKKKEKYSNYHLKKKRRFFGYLNLVFPLFFLSLPKFIGRLVKKEKLKTDFLG